MNRRKLLSTVAPAALAVSGVAAAAPVPVNPDAYLIALCAQFEALEHKSIASLAKDDSEQERADAITSAIDDEQAPIVDAITALRPSTLAGLTALAKVVVLADCQLLDPFFDRCLYSDRMLQTLLLGLTEGAAA